MTRAAGRHRRAQLRQLVAARLRRVRCAVLVDRHRGQCGALRPGGGERIGVGAQHDAGGVHRLAQLLRGREAEHRAVDGERLAGTQRGGDPLDVRGRGAGRDLHQLDAGAGELRLGLHPIAAVGEQRGAIGQHHQRGHRAGEAREPRAALPVPGQVLRQVRIAGRQQHGIGLPRGHRGAQALQAQPDRGSACVHAGPDRGWRPRRPGGLDLRTSPSRPPAGGHRPPLPPPPGLGARS